MFVKFLWAKATRLRLVASIGYGLDFSLVHSVPSSYEYGLVDCIHSCPTVDAFGIDRAIFPKMCVLPAY